MHQNRALSIVRCGRWTDRPSGFVVYLESLAGRCQCRVRDCFAGGHRGCMGSISQESPVLGQLASFRSADQHSGTEPHISETARYRHIPLAQVVDCPLGDGCTDRLGACYAAGPCARRQHAAILANPGRKKRIQPVAPSSRKSAELGDQGPRSTLATWAPLSHPSQPGRGRRRNALTMSPFEPTLGV